MTDVDGTARAHPSSRYIDFRDAFMARRARVEALPFLCSFYRSSTKPCRGPLGVQYLADFLRQLAERERFGKLLYSGGLHFLFIQNSVRIPANDQNLEFRP